MDTILTSLGINNSLFIHFGIFFIAYLVLSRLIFIPYMNALKDREARTVGSQDLALKIREETERLRREYQEQARQINSEIKKVMDAAKKEASTHYQQEVQRAQSSYLERLDQLKSRVETSRAQALTMVDQEVGSVSQVISDKLLGRNVHV